MKYQNEFDKVLDQIFVICKKINKDVVNEKDLDRLIENTEGLNQEIADLNYTLEYLLEEAEERGRIKESKQKGE